MKGIARIRISGWIRLAELTGMKHTASARKSSSATGISTRSRKSVAPGRRFAVCVKNDGYEASLERNKIYVVVPDEDAEQDGDLRVVDESGEADQRISLPRRE